MALGMLAACQGYAPRPLDAASHRTAWHARLPKLGAAAEVRERFRALTRDGAQTTFDPTDGLTLVEGRWLALAYHPDLRSARLRVGRAAASAKRAGTWSDPHLGLDVRGIAESVPDPWVVASELTLAIPLSDRLGAERDLAGAELRAAAEALREAEWHVWHEVARAWFDWSATELLLEEGERNLGELEELASTALRLADAGELPRPEATLFEIEEARARHRIRHLRGELAAGEERLRAVLGLAPEAPVDLLPELLLPGASPDGGAPEGLAERNPGLARLRMEYEASEERLRREVARQVPDLTLGPAFESDAGQARIGLAGGLPLPVLSANRRAIVEARFDRELARAAHETAYERLVGRWASATARARSLEAERTELEELLVPLVERQLEDALRLVRLGEASGLVLLESLERVHEVRTELIRTRTDEALVQAELEHLLGPPLPDADARGPQPDTQRQP